MRTKVHHNGNYYYRNFLRNLRAIVKCGICGHKQRIEFHHIKPTKLNGQGRGLWKRAIDIKRHPDCYIPLCYFCHQKVTSSEIILYRPISVLMYWAQGNLAGEVHVI